jgi:hypothetical protein
MPTYGRQVLQSTGRQIMVAADGFPEWKTGGVTIDWATVAAVSGSDATLDDGTVVKVGQKYLRYGQVLTYITASGKYGPYDAAATDGRQTLARGRCSILNETVLENGPLPGLPAPPSDHPAVLEGGLVWRTRLLATTGTASLAAGPTFTALEGALPRLRYAEYG